MAGEAQGVAKRRQVLRGGGCRGSGEASFRSGRCVVAGRFSYQNERFLDYFFQKCFGTGQLRARGAGGDAKFAGDFFVAFFFQNGEVQHGAESRREFLEQPDDRIGVVGVEIFGGLGEAVFEPIEFDRFGQFFLPVKMFDARPDKNPPHPTVQTAFAAIPSDVPKNADKTLLQKVFGSGAAFGKAEAHAEHGVFDPLEEGALRPLVAVRTGGGQVEVVVVFRKILHD